MLLGVCLCVREVRPRGRQEPARRQGMLEQRPDPPSLHSSPAGRRGGVRTLCPDPLPDTSRGSPSPFPEPASPRGASPDPSSREPPGGPSPTGLPQPLCSEGGSDLPPRGESAPWYPQGRGLSRRISPTTSAPLLRASPRPFSPRHAQQKLSWTLSWGGGAFPRPSPLGALGEGERDCPGPPFPRRPPKRRGSPSPSPLWTPGASLRPLSPSGRLFPAAASPAAAALPADPLPSPAGGAERAGPGCTHVAAEPRGSGSRAGSGNKQRERAGAVKFPL